MLWNNPQSAKGPGRLLVCFDFEGSFGMPHDVPYDVGKAASLILERLASYEAHAVFFIRGADHRRASGCRAGHSDRWS